MDKKVEVMFGSASPQTAFKEEKLFYGKSINWSEGLLTIAVIVLGRTVSQLSVKFSNYFCLSYADSEDAEKYNEE